MTKTINQDGSDFRDELVKAATGPKFDFGYRMAVFFLAGHYAAENVREHQQYAFNRGGTLSKDEIAKLFKNAAEYMADRIDRTSKGREE